MKMTLLRILLTLPLACMPAATGVVDAQLPEPTVTRSWTSVRLAKWVLFGAAIGFGAYAVSQSQRADNSYGELGALCRAELERCRSVGNRYADERAEQLYQNAVAADRRAHQAIIGGEVTLLGSAALFIYDLRNRRGPPDIPYPATTQEFSGYGFAIGARLAF